MFLDQSIPRASFSNIGLIRASFKNLKDYGVEGGGNADETAKIQSVIDLGGNIWVPSGLYVVQDLYISKSNTYLRGEGPVSQFKRNPLNSGSARILNINKSGQKYIENVIIEDLLFDGAKNEISGGNAFGNENECVNGDNSLNVKINNCWAINAGQDGLDFDGSNIGLTITNCVISGSNGNGIHLYGVTNSNISFNRIINCGTAWNTGASQAKPWAIDYNDEQQTGTAQFNFARNIICMGNIIDGCTQGISIGASSNANIIGNSIYGANGGNQNIDQYGVGIEAGPKSKNVIISSNFISGAFYNGITMASASGGQVFSNKILNANRFGIEVFVSRNSQIGFNHIEGSLAHGIEVTNSSGSLISANKISSNIATGVLGGIRINNSSNNITVSNNVINGYPYGVIIGAGTNNWLVDANNSLNNFTQDIFISPTAGETGVMLGNLYTNGAKCQNRGSSAILVGQTSGVINHGLWKAPTFIQVQPIDNMGSATKMWVDHALTTDTQFIVRVDSDPTSQAADFIWKAERNTF
jgi:parallel beta-helix repeat protein